jgi:hypothetical protein
LVISSCIGGSSDRNTVDWRRRRAGQVLTANLFSEFPKYRFPDDPNQSYIHLVPSHRGAYRDRHGRGTGCGGRGSIGARSGRRAVFRERLPARRRTMQARGRRSRVVLTPRRWRQVLRRRARPNRAKLAVNPQGDGGKKARSPGRARYKPLKPLRAGMPGESGCNRGEFARVLLTLLHARLRVRRAPGIPHALLWARFSSTTSGAHAPRDR